MCVSLSFGRAIAARQYCVNCTVWKKLERQLSDRGGSQMPSSPKHVSALQHAPPPLKSTTKTRVTVGANQASKPSKQISAMICFFFWGGGRVSANSAVTGVRTENELGDVSLSSKESPSRAVRAPCSGRPQHVVALVKVEE